MNELIIVGAGIIGLTTAYKILQKHPNSKIVIIEKEKDVAFHQTSRNSGVLHTGIYYQPGSMKAKNCISGYKLMLQFCDEFNIPYELCGKTIVATTPQEIPLLKTIYDKGIQNGLNTIRMIDVDELMTIEPHVRGLGAIHVPEAGIISYKAVAQHLKLLLETKGVVFIFNEEVRSFTKIQQRYLIRTDKHEYETTKIINCGGLYSDILALKSGERTDTRIIPFRGEYYKLKSTKKHLVKNLIYPIPDPSFPFLGVHFTRTINGDILAGPNAVLAFQKEGYHFCDFNPSEFWQTIRFPGFSRLLFKYWKRGGMEMYRSLSKNAFTKSLQKLIPEIEMDDIEQTQAGVRAQAINNKGNLVDDFQITYQNNIINVINAPSPAATSSFAIGEYIEKIYSK